MFHLASFASVWLAKHDRANFRTSFPWSWRNRIAAYLYVAGVVMMMMMN